MIVFKPEQPVTRSADRGKTEMTEVDPGVDRLLCDFFQKEMPSPWPALRTLESGKPVISRTSRRWSLIALAASIAILVASQFLFSSLYVPRERRSIGAGDARNEAMNRDASVHSRGAKAMEPNTGDVLGEPFRKH